MKNLKPWQIAILITSAIFFIIEVNILVNIFNGKSADTGSLSDWLSTGADIAMAVAALYAAWLAKNWLKPNLQQQGLPKVVAFLQNEISESLINDFEIIYADTIKNLVIKLKDNLDSSSDMRMQSQQDIYNFKKNNDLTKSTKTVNFLNPIHFDKRIKEFEWYGFKFKNNKAEIVNELLVHKSNLLKCNVNLTRELYKFDASFYSDYVVYNISHKEKISFKLDIIIQKLNDISQEQIYCNGEMRDLYKKLMGVSPLVTDFFDIKES